MVVFAEPPPKLGHGEGGLVFRLAEPLGFAAGVGTLFGIEAGQR
jgi:hypothetical protein